MDPRTVLSFVAETRDFPSNVKNFKTANEELIPRDLEALRMSFCYPSSPRKLAMTVACFASGAAHFAFGIHLSYLNVAPQQARTKARYDFVKERLRQKQGK